jgi:hypothetical protein
VDHWISVYATAKSLATGKLAKRYESPKQLKSNVLNTLIQNSWLEGEAAERGVRVSAAEVLNEVNELKVKLPEDYRQLLADFHHSTADLRQEVNLALLADKLERLVSLGGGRKNFTEADVARWEAQVTKEYNEHKSRYMEPERRTVQLIVAKTEEEASKALSEIRAGKAFASVAKRYSIALRNHDVTKAGAPTGVEPATYTVTEGYDQAGGPEGSLNITTTPFFSHEAQLHALKGPVKGSFDYSPAYYVFEVRWIVPRRKETLAKAKLFVSGSEAFSKFTKEFENKWKARTNCRSGYVVPVCRQGKAIGRFSVFFRPPNLAEEALQALRQMERGPR